MCQRSSSRQPSVSLRVAKRITFAAGIVLSLLTSASAQMQTVSVISTFAGDGTAGFSGDGGQATAASLDFPRAPAVDSAGNIYISDYTNNRLRVVAPNGIITTIAGNGTAGSAGDGGPATGAELNHPNGTAFDSAGNIYICEYLGNRIRKIDAATGTISTIAGTGAAGYSGDGGPATAATLYYPLNPTFDSAGNLYFSDYTNNRVRKITMATGVITTVAGTGAAATTGNGGLATSAALNGPVGVVFDTAGNMYISERNGNVLRKVAAGTGIISTFAGTGTAGFAGDGGPATSAKLNIPYGIAFDASGDVFVSDVNNQRVRMVNITTGIITTVAGNGTAGFSGDGGPATSAELNNPTELVTDTAGHLYVADESNNRIREFALSNLNFPATNVASSSATRIVQLETTVTETITSITIPQSQGGAQEYSIGTITGCTVGASNPVDTVCTIPITFSPAYPGRRWIPLEVVTSTGKINFGVTGIGVGPLAVLTPGVVSTYAGTGTAGYLGDGGPATSAEVGTQEQSTADYAGNLYIVDNSNERIRKVTATTGVITTVAGNGTGGYSGDGGLATSAEIYSPEDVEFDSAGNFYIADQANNRVRKVSATTGIITTVAGTGVAGFSGDGGPATSAELYLVDGVTVDAQGNLYIVDSGNQRIRKVSATTGIITTIAGNGVQGFAGDGGPATSAEFNDPPFIAIDNSGNLFIADEGNHRIREINTAGIITTVAGNGTPGFSGDGGPATSAELNYPTRIAIDNANNLYISDFHNNRLRKVDAQTGIITTLMGNGAAGSTGDGGPASKAELNGPVGVGLDGAGNLFISEYTGYRVRKIDQSQSIFTYPTPTTVGTSDTTDGPQTATASNIGNATLTIPPPSSGNDPSVAANFLFDSSSTCPQLSSSSSAQSLAPGADCTIAIDFEPEDAGVVTGTGVLTDTSLNVAAATQTIHLSGTGLAVSTTTTVVGSPNPSTYSQSVTFTATVAPTKGSAVPTGTVQFSVDGTAVGGPVTLVNGTATFTSSTLIVGSHSVKAVYVPDSTAYTASNGTVSQVVTKATPGQNGVVSVVLTSAPNPSDFGQLVTFTATVPNGATGTVQFEDGTTVLGTGTISGTTATFSTTTLAVGTHSMTAVYSGDVNYNTATSAVDNQVVNSSAFPPTPVHSTSAAENIFVTIPSTETITSISIPQSQGGQQEYTIQSITGCTVGASNPAGTVCTISITFTPAYPGQRWVPLQVVASGGNFNVGLTGIGLGPLAVLTPGIISTYAGNGTAGYSGDGGAATSAELDSPHMLAEDAAGNLYIVDYAESRVRKVTATTGTITTVAGNGTAGYSGDGGLATNAELNLPVGAAVDAAGNLYITDYNNFRVRKVSATTGIITTVAGNGTQGYSGDGGPATSAELNLPTGIALDSAGNFYFADSSNHRVRKVSAETGIITTVAGDGTAGDSGDGGAATSAAVNNPHGLVVDAAGNLYISDFGNRVRKVSAATGIITTVAGDGTAGYSGDGGAATSAELSFPYQVWVDNAGNLYIADFQNNRVREVDAATGIITTVAGTGVAAYGGDGGTATKAKLQSPLGIVLDGAGNLYIADAANYRIRMVNVSQSSLTYPTPTTVGTEDSTDSPQSVVVSNIGNAALTIPPPSSGNDPSLSASFLFDSSSTCPQLGSSSSAQSLASGADCTIAIDFEPEAVGAVTGTAVLTDTSLNAAAATQTIQLSGTGVAVSTTTTVAGSPNPSAYSQSVTFTATVAPTKGTAVPTGTVQFSIDGTPAGGPVTLTNGTATYTTSTLAVGTHSITAVYTPGAGTFTGSNGTTTQTVNKATLGQNGLANITLVSSPNPSIFNQSVIFTATVPSGVTGTVQFIDGTTVLGTATISGTIATFTISTLAVGTHPVTAAYGGNVDYNPATSAVDNQVVTTVPTSATTLSVLPATVMYGNPATLTAVVTPGYATGTVSFYEGTTLLGTASLDNTATAVLPISTLNAGVHNITATYNGDPVVPSSTSNTVQLTVIQRTAPGGGPAITITVNDATRTTTQANPPFTYSPSGQLVNGDTFATAISGTANYSTTAGTAPGTYSITVSGLTSADYTIAFVPGTLTVTISPTTTTLVASPSSTQYGSPVTLTATVTSGATGTVSFYDGTVLLGTGTVSNGVATLTTTMLNAGTHSITAVYNGDATYASSQSSPATVTVAQLTAPGGGAALTITVQNASRPYGTADPQFSYVVTGTLVNGDTYASAITGVPVYSAADTPTSSAGSTFPINLSGLSSQNYQIAIVPGTLTIVTEPTTTALTESTNSVQYGDPVTLTATVAPGGATGTVVFTQGSTVLGTGTVSGGVATLTTSSLPAGSYTITAGYQGDTDYGASTSTPVTLTITPRTAPGGGAALTVTVNNASRVYGTANPAFSYTVTGTLVNGDTYATAVTGVPVYSTTATPGSAVGAYPVSIAGGLNSNNYAIAFVSGTLTVTKTTLSQSQITLTSSPNPSVYQQPVTFTATVPSGVTGTVQFVQGTTVLGTGTISGTTATFTTSTLAVGTDPVTAVYSGDANYNPATSAVDNQVVNKATLGQNGLANITLASAPNPSTYDQSVTFTATVPSGVTGTVQFIDGTTVLGTSTISGTTATFTISTLAVGTHPVTAAYSGDANYNSATSAVDNQVVTTVAASATSLSVSPATVMYGNPATLTAVVTPSYATGTVSFYEGTTLLGTASLDNTATAVLPISTLNAGVHNITATYNGDPIVPSSTSNTVQLTVTQRTAPGGGPAITITVNDATRTTTQANPPFTYSPSGQLVNGDTFATAISGTANYTTTAGTTPGTYSVTVSGLTSANYTIAFVPGTLTVTISPSTTTLVASPSSTQYGSPVTLTATVTSGATGTVSFYDGTVLLGTGTVSNGVATLTTTMLNAGTHSITAVYNGDATYASSQSSPATVTVAQLTAPGGGAALTITVQNASRQYGAADPQFSYVVTGTLVNGDTYASAITGVPVYSAADTPTSSAGSTFPINLSGLSSQNYQIAIVPGTLTIVTDPTTTALTESTNSAQYGDPVTLTATVAPSGATGTVVFTQGSTVLGTGTVSGGVATLTTSSLPAGSYTITASYQGDTNYGASTSTPVTLTITPRTAPGGGAALTVTVNNASRVYGTANPAFSYTVTGTLVNGDTYATAVTGVPVYSTTATPTSAVGAYPVSIAGGLNSNNYVIAFVNGTLTVTKATLSQSQITLTSSPNPSVYQQPVTFTATVPSGVTGTVQFMQGTTLLGTGTISGTTATFTTSTLAVGTDPVTAVYSGDANYNPATSAVDNQVVNKATLGQSTLANITLVSTPNPSTFNQSVIFTATVPSGVTGTVQFIDGTTVLGTSTISGTIATFTISTLAVGTHPVTAAYSGDANYNPATSAVDSQLVTTVASSTTILSVSPATVMYGNPATLTAVVTPSFATGTVSFYEGTTLLGTATLDNTATAVLPISTLNAGVHNITAKYNGDPVVPSSTSNTVQLTVTQRTAPGGGPAITITANNASRTTSQANPPFTYSAAGQLVNGDTYATAISGTATYSTAAGTTPGTYSITVSGLTSQNYSLAFVPGTLTVSISPSTTTLVAGPSSTQYGSPVTLTATVTSGATGSVSFYDGSVLLGTGTVSNGVATLTTTTLNAGTHTITAVYNGDATYASSQSGPATVTVTKLTAPGGGAALTITVQNASRPYGTADPQFSYVVTGTLVNGDTYASAITGVPVYAVADTAASAAGSTFPISVGGLTSANYQVALVNGTLTIVTEPTTTALIESTSSAQYGDPVTLTATVVPTGATGTVVFTQGNTVIGTGTVSGGIATLTTSSLPAGTYTITATYQGDANYGASTSTPVTLTITPRTAPGGGAALTVTVNNVSRAYGQGNPGFTYTATGALVNGNTYATAITGVPVYATTAIPASLAGAYPISIMGGLNSTNYVIAFVNGTLTVSKDTPGQNGITNITLTSAPNPSTYSQSVTFTATLPAGATGTVQFVDGTTALGTGNVSGTTATFTTSALAVGTHPVTAVYSGDPNFNPATSAVDNQVVESLDFTLTLTSAGSQTVIPGNAAPYTVQVAPTNVNYPGTVTFSATGLPPGATITFSPATVAANSGITPSNVTVQTAAQKAALKSSVGSLALALLMFPFAASRRIRRSTRRYFYLLIVLLSGVAATTGLTGCGYNGNGFFGQAPHTYDITITAASGTIRHSVNVTLNVQ